MFKMPITVTATTWRTTEADLNDILHKSWRVAHRKSDKSEGLVAALLWMSAVYFVNVQSYCAEFNLLKLHLSSCKYKCMKIDKRSDKGKTLKAYFGVSGSLSRFGCPLFPVLFRVLPSLCVLSCFTSCVCSGFVWILIKIPFLCLSCAVCILHSDFPIPDKIRPVWHKLLVYIQIIIHLSIIQVSADAQKHNDYSQSAQ